MTVAFAVAVSVGAMAGCTRGDSPSPGLTSAAENESSAAFGDAVTETPITLESDSGSENIRCADILAELLAAVDTNCDTSIAYGDATYDSYFEYLYDAKLSKAVDGAFGYASASYADEVTVILLADDKDVDRFLEKLDERVARRKTDFEGYKPEEVAKLDLARRAASGRYIVMAVCDDSDKAIHKFLEIVGDN